MSLRKEYYPFPYINITLLQNRVSTQPTDNFCHRGLGGSVAWFVRSEVPPQVQITPEV